MVQEAGIHHGDTDLRTPNDKREKLRVRGELCGVTLCKTDGGKDREKF